MQGAARTQAPYAGSPSPQLSLLLETPSLGKVAQTSFRSEGRSCNPELPAGKRSSSVCCPVAIPGQDGQRTPSAPSRSWPRGCSGLRLINERSRLGSSGSPVSRAANSSEAKSPFSVSPAANYSFPVRQSVLNLAVRGLPKEIVQQCPLSGSLRNNILRDRRKLMRKCGVYKPLSLPMLEGLTINTWSITRSSSKDFFKRHQGGY